MEIVIAKHNFKRSGQMVRKIFHQTLNAIIKINHLLLIELKSVDAECTIDPWKYFKACVGALDGTYIKVHVPRNDQARYKSEKGFMPVNILGVCNRNLNFMYVLTKWEGSVPDCRVLRDALHRPCGLLVSIGT